MKYDLNTCEIRADLIDPVSFSPFPKNPVIARFFKEIGWADELGSGVRNLFRFSKEYSGQEPQLIEGDIFKIDVPTPVEASDQVTAQAPRKHHARTMQEPCKHHASTAQAADQVTAQAEGVLKYCVEPKSSAEILDLLGLKHREHFRKDVLVPLVESGQSQLTLPDKLTSPKQKYVAVKKGEGNRG